MKAMRKYYIKLCALVSTDISCLPFLHSKKKIGKDPNNTKWTRDTNTFGQKILRAQGWQPGQFLGAQNAPHSEHHTAANASYIRVVLKDDMKGLGFSRSKEDEVTGLDVFQDLLSRLNGKTDDVIEEEQQTRLAVKANYFVEQRYGPMRFVYGGLLVGDEMKEAKEDSPSSEDEDDNKKVATTDVEMKEASTPKEKESKKDKKSKKRKASDDDDESSSRESESKSKKRRKEERKLKESDGSDGSDGSYDTKAKKKEKKEKKDKSRKKDQVSEEDDGSLEERSKKRKSKSKDKSRSSDDSEDEKTKAKKAKKEKKEKKRRKEEAESSASATPVASGTSTPQGSRNFVRSRFIAQKRQAFMDPKALAQVCC